MVCISAQCYDPGVNLYSDDDDNDMNNAKVYKHDTQLNSAYVILLKCMVFIIIN